MRSNFNENTPMTVARHQPRGLDYFMYGNKLKAQEKQAALTVAGSIDHNTIGVHEKDLPYISTLAKRSETQRDGFIDMVLDGKDFTMQDVRQLGDTFREAGVINKSIQEAKLNSQKIAKTKDMLYQKGLTTGNMEYYDNIFQDSMENWNGTFDGNKINEFTVSAAPDYVDLVGEAEDMFEVAMGDLTDQDRSIMNELNYEVKTQTTKGGLPIHYLSYTTPAKYKHNFKAIDKALSSINELYSNEESREGKFGAYMNRRNPNFMKNIMSDITNKMVGYRRDSYTPGQERSAGTKWEDGKTVPPPPISRGPAVTNEYLRQGDNYPGERAKYISLGDVDKVKGEVSTRMVKNKDGVDVIESYVDESKKGTHRDVDTYRKNEAVFHRAIFGNNKPTLSFIREQMDVLLLPTDSLEEGKKRSAPITPVFDKLNTDPTLSDEKEKLNSYIDELQRIKRNKSILEYARDEDSAKISNQEYYDFEAGNPRELELKENINNVLQEVYTKYNNDKPNRETTIPINFYKPEYQKAFEKKLAFDSPSTVMTIVEYNTETGENKIVGTSFGEGKNNTPGGEDLMRRVQAGLFTRGDGSKGETATGIQIIPGYSTLAGGSESSLYADPTWFKGDGGPKNKGVYAKKMDNAYIYSFTDTKGSDVKTYRMYQQNKDPHLRDPIWEEEGLGQIIIEDGEGGVRRGSIGDAAVEIQDAGDVVQWMPSIPQMLLIEKIQADINKDLPEDRQIEYPKIPITITKDDRNMFVIRGLNAYGILENVWESKTEEKFHSDLNKILIHLSTEANRLRE